MQTKFLFAFLLLLLGICAVAQDCPTDRAAIFLHANNVRTPITNSGSVFLSEDAQSTYQIPFTDNDSPTAILIQSLWLAGKAPDNALRLSAQEYGVVTKEYDYLPGPLDESGNLFSNCADWNKVWTVYRFEIAQHLADFNDDGTIEAPLNAIFAWPGKGNPHFEVYNGFALPDTEDDYAPFVDTNADGIYDPMDGDYPSVAQSDILPQQITWTVFNDLGSEESGGTPLRFEIHLTSWAFNCTDNEQLQNATFNSFKVINRAGAPMDSVYLGLFTDFDLGCFRDDLFGSAPELNTLFAYNQADPDSDCPSNRPSYGANPPVQAVTLLNQELRSLTYFNNDIIVAPPPPGTTFPETPLENFHYLTGKWRDGTPLSFGNSGYDTTGTNPPTLFAFPDDPNDPDGWSQFTAIDSLLNTLDTRTVSSIYLASLAPSESQTIDIAYSYYREPGNDHLQNVSSMYDGVAVLQQLYDTRFQNSCTLPTICTDDCVYPGDTNADGIVNYCDFLPIGLARAQEGPQRTGPLFWRPIEAQNWPDVQFDGTNNKHIDADGNGRIDLTDFNLTRRHYDYTHSNYVAPPDVYQEGSEIRITAPANDFQDLGLGESIVTDVQLIEQLPDLYGLAFTMEYDTRYLTVNAAFVSGNLDYINFKPEEGLVEFAVISSAPSTPLDVFTLIRFFLNTYDEYPEPLPSDTTFVRLKNIKGVASDGSPISLGAMPLLVTLQDDLITSSSTAPAAPVPVRIFPNPTTGWLNIHSDTAPIQSLRLLSTSGQSLLTQNNINERQYQIALQDLPHGIYFLQVQMANQRFVRKVYVAP